MAPDMVPEAVTDGVTEMEIVMVLIGVEAVTTLEVAFVVSIGAVKPSP